MTRVMYDAVNPFAVPAGSQLVAGYVDGPKSKWPDAAWASFPGSVMVRIAVFPTTNDGHVIDVEQSDATPAEVPAWLTMRRAAGVDPTVYCSPQDIPRVTAACQSAGVAVPHFWVCNPDGDPTIPEGCVAKQYKWDNDIDTSSVADYWPGVDAVAEEDEVVTKLANTDAITAFLATVKGMSPEVAQQDGQYVGTLSGAPQGYTDYVIRVKGA